MAFHMTWHVARHSRGRGKRHDAFAKGRSLHCNLNLGFWEVHACMTLTKKHAHVWVKIEGGNAVQDATTTPIYQGKINQGKKPFYQGKKKISTKEKFTKEKTLEKKNNQGKEGQGRVLCVWLFIRQ